MGGAAVCWLMARHTPACPPAYLSHSVPCRQARSLTRPTTAPHTARSRATIVRSCRWRVRRGGAQWWKHTSRCGEVLGAGGRVWVCVWL